MRILIAIATLLCSLSPFAKADQVVPAKALLSWTHHGGFIAPPFQDQRCTIYDGIVVITRHGRWIGRHPLRFSTEVPSRFRLHQLLGQARWGVLISTRGVPHDVGVSEYRTLYPTSVLLERNAYPRGVRNSSPVTGALVRFTDLNCH